jgi:hypothetical protein
MRWPKIITRKILFGNFNLQLEMNHRLLLFVTSKISINCISGIVSNMWSRIWSTHEINKCSMDEIYIQMYSPSLDHIIICNYLPHLHLQYHQLFIVVCRGIYKFKLWKWNTFFISFLQIEQSKILPHGPIAFCHKAKSEIFK